MGGRREHGNGYGNGHGWKKGWDWDLVVTEDTSGRFVRITVSDDKEHGAGANRDARQELRGAGVSPMLQQGTVV